MAPQRPHKALCISILKLTRARNPRETRGSPVSSESLVRGLNDGDLGVLALRQFLHELRRLGVCQASSVQIYENGDGDDVADPDDEDDLTNRENIVVAVTADAGNDNNDEGDNDSDDDDDDDDDDDNGGGDDDDDDDDDGHDDDDNHDDDDDDDGDDDELMMI